jgi:hypothetical protein
MYCGRSLAKYRCTYFCRSYSCGFGARHGFDAGCACCGRCSRCWLGRTYAAAHGAPVGLVSKLSLPEYMPNFLPGVIAYALVHSARMKSYLWPPFILLLVAAYSILPTWVDVMPAAGTWHPLLWRDSDAGAARSQRPGPEVFVRHLPLAPVLHMVCGEPDEFVPAGGRILSTGMLIGIPVVLYHAIEKPMIKGGADLAGKWNAGSMAAAAAGS